MLEKQPAGRRGDILYRRGPRPVTTSQEDVFATAVSRGQSGLMRLAGQDTALA